MADATLLRWNGLALVLGGILNAPFVLVHPLEDLIDTDVATNTRWLLAHSLQLIGAIIVLFGLPRLRVRQMERAKQLGLIGFILAFAGTTIYVGSGMSAA